MTRSRAATSARAKRTSTASRRSALQIIDQCVALGVPFAREYGGQLANRSFGGVQVSRTFYCRGQTGQQLLLGAYSALCWQIERGQVRIHPRTEMLDLIVVDGHARGIVVRDLVTGEIQSHTAQAVVLATGGYSNIFYLSTNASGSNVTATYRAWKQGAAFANPCFTQIHPTAIPPSEAYQAKLTLMSESLRNDGRLWVPKQRGEVRPPDEILEEERDYFLERRYPRFGNLAPRDLASRAVKQICDEGCGVGPGGYGVYLDLSDAIAKQGLEVIQERYGNLFDMYQRITGEDAYKTPMRIYPAPHYTMGGLWVDYNLMSTIPGLFVIGEANFADHGANRLGASSLMQGLADGYFILPYTIGHYLATTKSSPIGPGSSRCARRERAGERAGQASAAGAGQTNRCLLSPNVGTPHVGSLRDGATRSRTQTGARANPGLARGVLARCGGARLGGDAESRTGICRAGRRLPRIRRTALP